MFGGAVDFPLDKPGISINWGEYHVLIQCDLRLSLKSDAPPKHRMLFQNITSTRRLFGDESEPQDHKGRRLNVDFSHSNLKFQANFDFVLFFFSLRNKSDVFA